MTRTLIEHSGGKCVIHYQKEDKKKPLELWKQEEGVATERPKKGRIGEEGGKLDNMKRRRRD